MPRPSVLITHPTRLTRIRLLEALEADYHVCTARGCAEARRLHRAAGFDAVVTYHRQADGSGLALTRALRSSRPTRTILLGRPRALPPGLIGRRHLRARYGVHAFLDVDAAPDDVRGALESLLDPMRRRRWHESLLLAPVGH